MNQYLVLSAIIAGTSVYLILCDLFRLPTIQATKAALKLTQTQKVRGYQALRLRLIDEIAKHIHLDSYKRHELTATLKYADIEQSPETYISSIIVKTVSRVLLIVPAIWLCPLLIPIIILWVIDGFWKSTKAAEKIVLEKRASIERELPRFVATIAQEIGANRDVLHLLEGYRDSADPVFKNEIEITIADMRSGNQEQALNRLAGRVGSSMMSEVVRGLLGGLRGDDSVVFFQTLSRDYRNKEIEMLELEAKKRPGKLNKYSLLLGLCIMATYIYVIFKQLASGVSSLF